jgi:hypothetical protein
MQNTSERMDKNEVSCGHTTTVNAIVAILFKTPTSVNVVAVMTDLDVAVQVALKARVENRRSCMPELSGLYLVPGLFNVLFGVRTQRFNPQMTS